MAKRAGNVESSSEPIGGRFYTRYSQAISEDFIESLFDEGVSEDTVHAIERESEKRKAARQA